MHTKNKQQIGAFGEQAVANFLIQHNIEVIERNWRVREGEIDIVALNASGSFHLSKLKPAALWPLAIPLKQSTVTKHIACSV
jgi:hypothetical protein